MHFLDIFLHAWVQRITGLATIETEKCRDAISNSLSVFFLFLFMLMSVVYARALYFPVLGIDTYTYALSKGSGDIYFEIIRGTWGFTALNQLVPGPLFSPLISMLFFLVTTTVSVFLVTIFWMGNQPDWKAYMTGAIMTLFPYWASQGYFSYYHYGYSLATLAGVLSVIIPWHKGGWRRCGISAVSVILGASMYQGNVTMASGLVGASLLVGVTNTWIGQPQTLINFRSLLRVALSLMTGSVLYLLAHQAVLALTHMPSLSSGYNVHLSLNFFRVLQSVSLVIPGNNFLLPSPAVWLLAVPFLVFFLTIICKLKEKPSHDSPFHLSTIHIPPHRSWQMLFCLVPLFALVLFSPLSLTFIQGINLAPRSTCSVAFIWGAIFLIAAKVSCDRWKKTLIVTSALLCIFFAGRINYAWQVQTLTTEADISDARRMNQRLSDLPEFLHAPKPLDVALVGCISEDARSWPQDYEAIFGLSQFACFNGGNLPAHAGAALRFVGGHIKTVPVENSDLMAALGRVPWPASESVFWNGDHAVIWLGPETRQQVTMKQRIQRVSSALMNSRADTINKKNGAEQENFAQHRLLDLVRQGNGPWSGHGLQTLVGHIDATFPLAEDTRYIRVVGWAFDLAVKKLPEYVALLDCNGDVVGLAVTGIYRKDLQKKVAVDAEYAGFEGYALAEKKICSMAY